MSETMTPTEAARVLAEASRYEGDLVQRTEGLTAIVWGLVTPAIWTTYGFMDAMGGMAMPWVALAWLPWVAAGAVATFAIWRSAALSHPGLSDRRGLAQFLRWLGLVVVMSLAFAVVKPMDPSSPLVIVGAVWLAMAAFNVWNSSPRGRRIWGGCGLVLLATGGILSLLHAPMEVAGMTALLVSGLVPFGAGLWQTLQG